MERLQDTDLGPEIVLARVMLSRALRAAPPPIGTGTRRRGDTDWWRLIDRLMGRVGRLAAQRAVMAEGHGDSEMTALELALAIQLESSKLAARARGENPE